jgi:SAM-dependent methyltransferase
MRSARTDLSIVIPTMGGGSNLERLLPEVLAALGDPRIRYELLVVRGKSSGSELPRLASACRFVGQEEEGYGSALRSGLAAAQGEYILTLDSLTSDLSTVVRRLWERRVSAEVLVATRCERSSEEMSVAPRLLRRALNAALARGLSLPVWDLSSGDRLYRADVLRAHRFRARGLDILPEILVRLYSEGWRVREVPFRCTQLRRGFFSFRMFAFGIAYLRAFWSLWRLRNSIRSADYDDRAFDSILPPQRYWQRRRYKHVTDLIDTGAPVLDVGSGSSRILSALPPGSVALDILLRKLRYARKFPPSRVQGSACALPFRDRSFACVVCSQVIEHLPREAAVLDELCRVLVPGGRLILGTPDYGRWVWPAIERVYGLVVPYAYAAEHITHYTRDELVGQFTARGYRLEAEMSILRAELILAFRKPCTLGAP